MSRPRVCGPDVIESKYPSVNEEPSPRAWAGHTHDSHTVRHLGAVPACVGRTRTLPIAVKTYLSRPRVRGPDMSREPAIWTQSEPSPRAWAGHSLTWANAVPDVQHVSLRDGRGITPTR